MRWQALWDRSPHRTVFSRLDYIQAVSAAAKLKASVVIVSRDGEDVAGAAVTWKRRGPYREVIVPPLTPFSAVILSGHPAENEIHGRTSAFEQLLDAIERHFDVVRLHLPPSLPDVRAASWRGWDVQPFYTYVVSLPADPATWSGSVSRNYRRSLEAYEWIEGDEAVSVALRLCSASYARHRRRPPLSNEQMSIVARTALSSGLARGYAVRDKGTGSIDAAVVVARWGNTASYWVAGSEPGPSMTVLVGELFSRLAADGVEYFDFVGANTPGIAEFKRKFGSVLVPYYGIVRIGRPELKLLYRIRSILN